MTARRWLLLALAAAAVLLLAGRALAQAYVDYRWYEAMGAEQVWRATALTSARPPLASVTIRTLELAASGDQDDEREL